MQRQQRKKIRMNEWMNGKLFFGIVKKKGRHLNHILRKDLFISCLPNFPQCSNFYFTPIYFLLSSSPCSATKLITFINICQPSLPSRVSGEKKENNSNLCNFKITSQYRCRCLPISRDKRTTLSPLMPLLQSWKLQKGPLHFILKKGPFLEQFFSQQYMWENSWKEIWSKAS